MEAVTLNDGTTRQAPVVRAYTSRSTGPFIPRIMEDGPSLCYVEFTQHSFLAAQQDPRIVMLDSVHSRRPVVQTVDDHAKKHGHSKHSQHAKVHERLAEYGVTDQYCVHDLLLCLHHYFESEPGFLLDR
jgi:hypothetical protein